MKNASSTMILGLALGILVLEGCAGTKPASQEQPDQPSVRVTTGRSESPERDVPVYYKPPVNNVSGSRVVAALRGPTDNSGPLSLYPLAPDHPGQTISPHPAVYWYLPEGAEGVPLELTLTNERSIEPLVEKQLPPLGKRGVYHLRLSDYRLEPDVVYTWSIALVPDPTQRSKDIIAGGEIQRVEPSGSLSSELQSASKQDLARVYAEEGLWYDALEAISKLIDAKPNDRGLRELRAALLEQVALGVVAEYDKIAVR